MITDTKLQNEKLLWNGFIIVDDVDSGFDSITAKALTSHDCVNQSLWSSTKTGARYIMLSFDMFESKADFCCRFGYDPYEKFLKGEVFSDQVEGVE